MAEEKKPGLLKRIFSFGFGKKKKAEPEVEDTSAAQAEEAARKEAEAAAAEQARQEEAERLAAEKAAAEKAEQEEAERLAAEKLAAEEALKKESEEKARKKEEARAAEEKAASEAAEKKAAQETARKEAEEAAAEQARKEEADRLAKEKAAAEKAEKEEAERLSAEKLAAKEALKKEAEEAARKEAETRAAEEKVVREAAEKEEAERLSAEKLAQEEKARLEADVLRAETKDKTSEDLPEALDKPGGSEGIIAKTESEPAPEEEDTERKEGWFKRLRKGLSRSSSNLKENITAVFTKKKLDDDTLQDLEDILIQADLGVETAMNITEALSDQRYGKDVTDEEVRDIMAEEITKVLVPVAQPLELDLDHQPHVILVVGVNGSGKTTTIGKISKKLYDGGFSTMLAAGDTFRAAAIEQLHIWGERTGAPVMSREHGADAAGLAFDAYAEAKQQNKDVLLIDTAGRLQNKKELMDELEKIIRVLKKQDVNAPHTVLLTLDATTGQNALNQVEIFKDVAGVNGLVMTKLDGTARGGILVSIAAKHKLPVYFVGVGEQVEDLEPFEADVFARAIAGLEDD